MAKFCYITGQITEDPLDAIKREVMEELGYTLDELSHFKTYDQMLTEDVSANFHVYQAKFPGFEYFSDSDEVKVSDLALFSLDETHALRMLPIARVVIKDLQG
jgi:8-oxo-dGTP pyrophosphatase MutT (NUDIX family)